MTLEEKVTATSEAVKTLKMELIREIKKEFDSYHLDKVYIDAYYVEDNLGVELNPDFLDKLTDKLDELDSCPIWLDEDGYGLIDNQVYLESKDGELYLYMDRDRLHWMELDENNPVGYVDLSNYLGILKALRLPEVRELNQIVATE